VVQDGIEADGRAIQHNLRITNTDLFMPLLSELEKNRVTSYGKNGSKQIRDSGNSFDHISVRFSFFDLLFADGFKSRQ